MQVFTPKEAAELLDKYIEAYNERPVFHDSPRSPFMDDLVQPVEEAAKKSRAEERQRLEWI